MLKQQNWFIALLRENKIPTLKDVIIKSQALLMLVNLYWVVGFGWADFFPKTLHAMDELDWVR